MWKKIKIDDIEMIRCIEIILNSAEHYKDIMSKAKLIHLFNNKQGEQFYYQDGEMEITVGFHYNFYKKLWKVNTGAFIGGDPEVAMQITIDKIKEFISSKGKKEGYILIENIDKYEANNQIYLDYLFKDIMVNKESTSRINKLSITWQ